MFLFVGMTALAALVGSFGRCVVAPFAAAFADAHCNQRVLPRLQLVRGNLLPLERANITCVPILAFGCASFSFSVTVALLRAGRSFDARALGVEDFLHDGEIIFFDRHVVIQKSREVQKQAVV